MRVMENTEYIEILRVKKDSFPFEVIIDYFLFFLYRLALPVNLLKDYLDEVHLALR